MLNSTGAEILESEVTKSNYATAANGVLTLQSAGKNSDITVTNGGSENISVNGGTFIASLSADGTINGVGENLTSNDSWIYSGTTLTTTTLTLEQISGITTDT